MKYLVLLLFLFATHFVNSQTTIWLENFTSEGNNSTTGNNDNTVNAAVDWTTSCASCNLTNEFRVRGNRFKVENTNEIATWTSEKILLTGFTNISITVDVDMDDNQLDANDCLRLYYRLNGSTTNISFPINGNLCDDGADPTVASYNFTSADTIQIVITGITTNNNEDIHFDNILVTGDSVITPPTPDSIYAVATSPFCGDFIISDTAKAIPLESQALIWLKANKGTSTITNGNTFATWNDNSANGYDVSQTTPANRPTFRDNNTDNFNHNPTVEFINDNLNRAAPGIFSLTNYNHINTYFVIKDKEGGLFQLKIFDRPFIFLMAD